MLAKTAHDLRQRLEQAAHVRSLEARDFVPTSLELLAKKGDEPDHVMLPPRDAPGPHEVSLGYDFGANLRTGLVHGPRAAYAYGLRNVAFIIGGGAELASRSLADKDESLVSGYGRGSIEARLPLGRFTLRGGAGGRAGVLAQSIEGKNAATTGVPAAPSSYSASEPRAVTFRRPSKSAPGSSAPISRATRPPPAPVWFPSTLGASAEIV